MANNGYDLTLPLKAREENSADLLGRDFIAHRDLVCAYKKRPG
ncbi:hypothetical protein [Legionella cardiaca]|uniref:Uncharacterized protein n=1 Tax=Legionella cardiaca TaxID=1071983 RepID=A0ABY8AQZ4_9GAMM|nr:hypothetical protein [Legionella cardiaca]WED43114.1 hypothetical protein PXX05_14625 [Legionella cardiaca]